MNIQKLDIKSFGAKIRIYRKQKGYELHQLALIADVSYRALINAENGLQLPSVDLLVKVFNVLGISFNDCIDDRDIEDNKDCYYSIIRSNLLLLGNSQLDQLFEIAMIINSHEWKD